MPRPFIWTLLTIEALGILIGFGASMYAAIIGNQIHAVIILGAVSVWAGSLFDIW
jgi:hypothetical protein